MSPTARTPEMLCLLLDVLCTLRALEGGAMHACSTLPLLIGLHMQQSALWSTLDRQW